MTVLVTVLGTQARETTYELDGRRIDACLAPEALVQLLPSQSSPWTVVCVCTAAAAEKTYTTLERRLGAMQMSPSLKRIDIPDGLTRDEVEEAIGTMVNEVVSFDDPEVIVDLTHGPRHLAALASVRAGVVRERPQGLARPTRVLRQPAAELSESPDRPGDAASCR